MDRELANQKLQMGVSLVKQGSYHKALAHLLPLHDIAPREPNILFFIALSYRYLKDYDRSIHFFEQLIKHHQRPGYLCSYANMLFEHNSKSRAKALLNLAITIDPSYFDAHYNLARLEQAEQKFAIALKLYRGAQRLQPSHRDSVLGSGQCLVGLGEYKKAISEYELFLNEYPDSIKVLYALACQYAQSNHVSKSVCLLTKCVEMAPKNKTFLVKYASVVADKGETEQAIDILLTLLGEDPFDVEVHNTLFQIKWLSKSGDPFSYFSEAFNRQTTNILTLTFVKKLIKNDQLLEARARLSSFLKSNVKHVEGLIILGHIERELGDFDKSLTILEQIPRSSMGLAAVLNEKVITYLCLKQYAIAESIARNLVLSDPKNQGWIALFATCLRLNNKAAEYNELYDYEKLVKFITVNDDIYFNSELKEDLIDLHKAKRHPLEQSLRQGTQTNGQLFDSEIITVQELKKKITPVFNTFFESLSLKPSHPAFVKIYNHYCYFGSWSVLLEEGGHHLNHFHSEGEFSACYYVSVPDAVKRGGQGWLKLGQPELSRWIKMEPDYCICPQEGSLAVFPSYMWHGTNPIIESCERVTVAFDMKRFSK
ncbi:tetratricopeptide repeat protein [Shewanella eurypsychrophilus]|uniref:Tetratricopeptide repeat protein n=1 Tax=Shewanella eurypsychrophilus TaxID=2593656 RepID=A0ABX6V3W7_9GAMM|nr:MULTISPECIES: tetratricopeptide repeat protein [Shewanella]QFU22057.1 tetratricopeptide repeat protein [Shewanella sp. YLB-09]QPG57346.1 tetratricopeptide repeat protein [Shewanella eurypsychrophilus]